MDEIRAYEKEKASRVGFEANHFAVGHKGKDVPGRVLVCNLAKVAWHELIHVRKIGKSNEER